MKVPEEIFWVWSGMRQQQLIDIEKAIISINKKISTIENKLDIIIKKIENTEKHSNATPDRVKQWLRTLTEK